MGPGVRPSCRCTNYDHDIERWLELRYTIASFSARNHRRSTIWLTWNIKYALMRLAMSDPGALLAQCSYNALISMPKSP